MKTSDVLFLNSQIWFASANASLDMFGILFGSMVGVLSLVLAGLFLRREH